MPEVRKERTGWRDEALSLRHRVWGWDAPAVDIDFLMVEYDSTEPKAVVEYKHEFSETQYANRPSYKAIRKLCDRAKVAFLAVRYATDFSWWRVVPLNLKAKEFIKEDVITLTEKDFVNLLYDIRGRKMPNDLFDIKI
jgi:hypothetical protein